MFGSGGRARRGWTCVEVVVVVVLVGLMASLLVALAPQARREARLTMDLSNLGRIASATSAYAADYDDQMWSFSWKKTGPKNPILPSQWTQFQLAGSDPSAGSKQAADNLARRAGRHPADFFPLASVSWLPHLLYSHLVLLEHMDAKLPGLIFVSTGDRERLKWAQNWEAFDRNSFAPCQPPGTNVINRRWPYSASYQLPTAWYDQSEPGSRIYQDGSHSTFFPPATAMIAPQRHSAVAFPASKVLLHDSASWHFGRRPSYFLHEDARVPMLMGDGAADVRTTSDSNRGWSPNAPKITSPTYISYFPSCWEPPAVGQFGSDVLPGHYRWTRSGLLGRDFGGPEVR